MSNNVDITLAADSKEVDRALTRMGQHLDKANAKIEKLKQGGKRSAQETASAFSRAGTAIAGTARGLVTTFTGIADVTGLVSKAVEALQYEIQKAKGLQAAARAESVSFGEAVRDTRAAFSQDDSLSEGGLEDAIVKISERTNALPKNIAVALQTAFSAKGSLDNQAALDAVEQAFRLNPNNVEQATTLAGRFLDVAQAGGVSDIRASAGFIQNIQASSRITTSEKVGENIIPAIKSITAFGDSLEESAELLVTLNRLLVDEQGRITATAGISLAGQLANLAPEKETDGDFKGQYRGKDAEGEFTVPAEQVESFRKAKTTTQRIASLNDSPELRRLFVSQASFQVKTREQSIAMLRATDEVKRQLADVQQSIKGVANPDEQKYQAKLFEDEIETQRKGKFQTIVTAKEETESAAARAAISDPDDYRKGSAESIEQEAFGKINLPRIDFIRKQAFGIRRAVGYDDGESPEDASLARLKIVENELRKGGGGGVSDADRIITPAIKSLEKQRDESNSAESEKLREAVMQGVGGALSAFLKSQATQTGTAPVRDPDMMENNRLLQQVSSTLDRIEREGNSPLVRQPDARRLSRE